MSKATMMVMFAVLGAALVLLVGANAVPIQQERLVLVDTDGGADDLAAILTLAKDPPTNIVAIVCSYGNVERDLSCDNVLRLLNFLHRTDIPVYPGCESPFLTNISIDYYFGPDGIGNASQVYPLPDNVTTLSKHGAIAMVDIVNERPGEVILMSLGPLTTAAVAHKLDPSFQNKLKDHVVMGGAMKGNIAPTSEFNIYDDVESAAVVFAKAPFPLEAVTWDLCSVTGPSWEWYDEWLSASTPTAKFFKLIFHIAVESSRPTTPGFVIACDFLTAALFVHPDLVTSSTFRHAQVEQCGFVTRGQVAIDYRTTLPPEEANVELINGINLGDLENYWIELVKQ